MHKSIIFLLGLLAFLLPVGPSINNTNALAFNDYGYEADQYENYAMDMANENYYYKSQDSDNIKKIKCTNINSNFNGLDIDTLTINLPKGLETNQANQEQLESIFENGQRNDNYGYRTNGNFDCINNNDIENIGGGGETGPQGPQGPRGLQGERGLPGEDGEDGAPGPSQILRNNIYTVRAPAQIGSGTMTSDVSCNDGDVALSGGFVGINVDIRQSQPIPTGTEAGWRAVGIGLSDTSSLSANVICFNNPEVSTAAVSAFQETEDSPIVSQVTEDLPELTATEKQPEDSPIVSQVTGDSPELTATEKITKLKTQWLDLLP